MHIIDVEQDFVSKVTVQASEMITSDENVVDGLSNGCFIRLSRPQEFPATSSFRVYLIFHFCSAWRHQNSEGCPAKS